MDSMDQLSLTAVKVENLGIALKTASQYGKVFYVTYCQDTECFKFDVYGIPDPVCILWHTPTQALGSPPMP